MRRVFGSVNHEVSNSYSANPNMHEEWLDGSVIHTLRRWAAPITLDAGWIVRIDTHYLGGRRHFMNWEVADLGFIVALRERGTVTAVKAAILQCKRLYPDEVKQVDESSYDDYAVGFARLFPDDEPLGDVLEPRTFSFSERSVYRALVLGDEQWAAIEQYEKTAIPIHYLYYHPAVLPQVTRLPALSLPPVQDVLAGIHVQRAADLRAATAALGSGRVPTYADVHGASTWSLEQFVADEVLACREGAHAKKGDQTLNRLFYRRSGPSAAAIAVVIDSPAGGGAG